MKSFVTLLLALLKTPVTLVSLLGFGLYPLAAVANVELTAQHYKVFEGTLVDGRQGLYFHPKETFIFISGGDYLIPLFIPAKHSGIFYEKTQSGYAPPQSWNESGLVSNASMIEAFKIHSADFNGDGEKDIFLQAKDGNTHSLVLYADAAGTLPSTLLDVGAGYHTAAYTAYFQDGNNDGYIDLHFFVDNDHQESILLGATHNDISYHTGGYAVSVEQPATINEGDTVTLSASVVDYLNHVQSVSFYAGNLKLAEVTAPPYTFDWQPLAGDYWIKSVVKDHQHVISRTECVPLSVVGNAITQPAVPTEQSHYNSVNQLMWVDGLRRDVNDRTHYQYDCDGRQTAQINALGHATQTLDFNDQGQPTRIIDANGVEQQLTYHPRGWLQESTLLHPSGNVSLHRTTTYQHDAVGNMTQVVQPSGRVLNYQYDAARRLIAVSNAQGDRIEYTLDNAGNRVAERIVDASGQLKNTVTRQFDELSRLRAITDADQHTANIDYDTNNNPMLSTNPKNHTTQTQYDALQRPTVVIDADQNAVGTTYNADGLITSVTDQRGLTTSYNYNGLGQLLSLQSPDTGLTTFTYDDAGNQTRRTDAKGVITHYQYDALNRLVAETYPSEPLLNKTYEYDGGSGNSAPYSLGRLTAVTDFAGRIDYRYNHAGQLIEQTSTVEGLAHTITYGYNLDGNLQQVCYSASACANYQFDQNGQVSGITWQDSSGSQTLASQLQYLPFGPATQLQYGNGLLLSLTYDQDYQLTHYQLSQSGQAVADLSYQYDPNGNITNITNGVDTSRHQSFSYDKLDRLVTDNGLYGDASYTYDSVGNRTSVSRHNNLEVHTYDYQLDSNRLQRMNTWDYVFDPNGNTISDPQLSDTLQWQGTRAFAYNANERLDSFYTDGVLVATYQYNALGQRVKKQRYNNGVPGEYTVFSYNQSGQLLTETLGNSAGVHTRQHTVWFGSMPVAQVVESITANSITQREIVYLHTDHLATPRLATNQSGTPVWEWQSDAFGVGTADHDVDGDNQTVVVNMRFPGQYYDQESGLYYNYFRDYDPNLGRYIQSDPIGLEGGINTYVYVEGNPLGNVDPEGLRGSPYGSGGYGSASDSDEYYDYGDGPSRGTGLPVGGGTGGHERCLGDDCETSFSTCYDRCVNFFIPSSNAGWMCAAAGLTGNKAGQACAYYGAWVYLAMCSSTCARYPCAFGDE